MSLLRQDKRTSRRKRISIAVAAALVVAGAGGFVVHQFDVKPQVNVIAKAASQPNGSPWVESPFAPALNQTSPAPAASPTSVAPMKQWAYKGQYVDSLIKSGDPKDAFTAYRYIQHCVDARSYEAQLAQTTNARVRASLEKLPKAEVICKDISEGQLTQRMLLLLKAAEARVPGAYGDLYKIETDDAFKDDSRRQEAIPRIIAVNIEHADPLTVLSQYQIAINCNDPPKCTTRNPEKALMLWTVAREARGNKGQDVITPSLVKELGEQRAAAAINEGRAIVAAARGKK